MLAGSWRFAINYNWMQLVVLKITGTIFSRMVRNSRLQPLSLPEQSLGQVGFAWHGSWLFLELGAKKSWIDQVLVWLTDLFAWNETVQYFNWSNSSLFLESVLVLSLNKQLVKQSLFTCSCHIRMLSPKLDHSFFPRINMFLEFLAPINIQRKIWTARNFSMTGQVTILLTVGTVEIGNLKRKFWCGWLMGKLLDLFFCRRCHDLHGACPLPRTLTCETGCMFWSHRWMSNVRHQREKSLVRSD